MPEFAHLHVHTQYSLLDGASSIPAMLDKAKADGQKACAISDHGNMFGVFEFVQEAKKRSLIPVVGCEFHPSGDRPALPPAPAGQKSRRIPQPEQALLAGLY
jgi:DNA polymerase-3 subunit alpha